MTESWKSAQVSDVQVGDVVRTASGQVVIVSRIEEAFMGMPTMVALIEDTPQRWFKCPQASDGQIEIQTAGS